MPRERRARTSHSNPSRRLARFYRDRFEKSTMPQVVVDSDGVLTEVNEAFARLVDRPADQLPGCPTSELNHRSDPGEADATLARLLSGALDAARSERVLERTDGRPVPTLVDATLLRDEDGRPVGAAALYQDLTLLHDVERRRQMQEEFFLALSQRASDLAVVLDPDGRVLFASPALVGVLGHAVEDVISADAVDFTHPDDTPAIRELFADVLASGGTPTATVRVRDVAGRWHWMELTAGNLLDTAVGGVVCNLRDVTDRILAEEALRASERRYRAIADNADEGLWVAAPDGRTVYINQRLTQILGLEPGQLLGRTIGDVLGIGDQPGSGRREVSYLHPDGGTRVLLLSATTLDDTGGKVEGSLAMVSDVTDARRLERELREAALHDTLTGLPNRALVMDRLEHALTRAGGSTAVVFVDIDRFRVVNETRGHTVGDELLLDVAARLRAAVRPADTVGRFGGDEFLILCEGVDETAAADIGGSVLDAFTTHFPIADGDVRLRASIGIALGPGPAATLLRNAETAMYAAKSGGRGRVRMFDPELAAVAQQRFELGVELARSLAADELRLHYQPIVDLHTGQVVGAEALARWDHHLLGPVPPARFVAAAEEEGLASSLDRWAVRRAVCEAGQLRESRVLRPTAYVAVNLSARSLADPELEHWVAEAVESSGVSPEDVVLEVTESAAMADAAAAAGLLGRLRDGGFRVAVDDFGTGHSSLSYLRRLPVSVLKVDRSFVAELTTDPQALAIARSIVDLARTMGLTVVAEGVESPEHAELLRRLGAHTAQGWLWSPAVSPQEAARSGALCRAYDVGSAGPSA